MAKKTQSRNVSRVQRTASKSASALRKGRQSVEASMRVVRKRVELGLDAIRDPATADYAELGKMLPEKIEAISSASVIFQKKSAMLAFQGMRFMTHEAAQATRHAHSLMASPNAIAALTSHTAYVVAAAQRMINASLLMSSMSATLIEASGTPSHLAVMANDRRLS